MSIIVIQNEENRMYCNKLEKVMEIQTNQSGRTEGRRKNTDDATNEEERDNLSRLVESKSTEFNQQ